MFSYMPLRNYLRNNLLIFIWKPEKRWINIRAHRKSFMGNGCTKVLYSSFTALLFCTNSIPRLPTESSASISICLRRISWFEAFCMGIPLRFIIFTSPLLYSVYPSKNGTISCICFRFWKMV